MTYISETGKLVQSETIERPPKWIAYPMSFILTLMFLPSLLRVMVVAFELLFKIRSLF